MAEKYGKGRKYLKETAKTRARKKKLAEQISRRLRSAKTGNTEKPTRQELCHNNELIGQNRLANIHLFFVH